MATKNDGKTQQIPCMAKSFYLAVSEVNAFYIEIQDSRQN